jgi:DNA polymerase I-like protein with 3'-5' exonuclease and polymerase domains
MKFRSNSYREIWAVDFEFQTEPGNRPLPVCLIAHEVLSGQKLRVWQDELLQMDKPPYDIGPDSLFVAYYASAEFSCHLALDWPLPYNILDLFTEFRNHTNGMTLFCGKGLVGALSYFGVDNIGALQKENMRDLILQGGPWDNEEKDAILDYCESDVEALAHLLDKFVHKIPMEQALLRGQYMAAIAKIEDNGIPIDVELFDKLKENWESIKTELTQRVDVNFGVFENNVFKMVLFEKYLFENRIAWPRTPSGRLSLKDDTFKDMCKSYPQLQPLKDLRAILSKLKLSDLHIGADGRNRTMLSAFGTITGRNTPSNSHFIFGPAVWLRSLIKPKPGTGLAYIDWSQQEFGIAAKLSKDQRMQQAYKSGDPYLAFAKRARAVPETATKETHGKERDQFKACVLGVNYGMGDKALAARIGQPVIAARQLIQKHRENFSRFWKWADGALDCAEVYGQLRTVFGWTIKGTEKVKVRALRNFPVQANGAEMLRLACILVDRQGVKICAPVHDALLIEAPLNELTEKIEATQAAMKRASELVLDGFSLNTDVEIIEYPERYFDKRGVETWDSIMSILKETTV